MAAVRRRRPGKDPALTREEVAHVAIERMAEPAIENHILGWKELTRAAADRYPEKGISPNGKAVARTPFKGAGGERDGLVGAVLREFASERGAKMLRRTGTSRSMLDERGSGLGDSAAELLVSVQSATNSDAAEIAELARPFILEAFNAAYRGSIGSDAVTASPGSSHRLRSLLLAHHRNQDVRKILHSAYSDRLQRYVSALERALSECGLGSRRELSVVIVDLHALLDGYLIQAVSSETSDYDHWANQFADAVVDFLAYNLDVDNEDVSTLAENEHRE